MMEELKDQIAAYVSVAGAFIAAIIGVVSRHVYHPDGFDWLRVAWDLPFAMLCALIAGGTAVLINAPQIVVLAMAGAFGHLGAQWLGPALQRFIEARLQGGKGDPEKDS